MDCELLEKCIFFNDRMESYPTTAAYLKRRYCQGDNRECARYLVYRQLGKGNVPGDLFPNGHDRIPKILKAAGVSPKG